MVVDVAPRPLDDERTDALFHALADATRRDLLAAAMHGERSVSALARAYPISLTAVQKHVGVLERAGLVTKTRAGREQLVRTDIAAVRDAARVLDRLEALWRGRVERMAALLDEHDDHTTDNPTDHDPARSRP